MLASCIEPFPLGRMVAAGSGVRPTRRRFKPVAPES
jgi:hypothetical protein